MKRSIAVVCIGVVLSTVGGRAAPLFLENFGNLANGTAVTVTNSALTYARVSTGAGSYLNAANPGSFSGASALLLSTSSSLTGAGVTNGTYASFDVGTLAFSFRTPASFAVTDDLYAFVGSGNTFSGNSAFSGNDVTAGFLLAGGQLQTRNSANVWQNVGSALLADTSYDLHIVFNGSASAVSYGSDSVAAGTADIWLDGSLFGNDVSIRDAVSVSAFRLYTVGSASATPFEVDNLGLYDAALAVPEPSVGCLFSLSSLLLLAFRRRNC